MKPTKLNPLLLLLTAFIWGTAFVAQKEGMDYIGPFTYGCVRNFLGALVLLPVIAAMDKLRSREAPFYAGRKKDILLGGLCCGLMLFVASSLQQMGIALQDESTNVGKAGFITACYCAIVPVMGLFFKKKSPKLVWLGVAVAVVGFFFLCLMDGLVAGQGLGLNVSDLLLALCALFFAGHILVIDHFVARADGVRLSCLQFFVTALLSLPFMFALEQPSFSAIADCWLPIVYGGVMSSGVAYTLQIVGQKGVNPAVASLILSLESVFAVLAGWLLMPASGLSGWELFGCALVFAAVLLVNLAPQGKEERL